jgi:membrane protease YdiL (CAAX protease family)
MRAMGDDRSTWEVVSAILVERVFLSGLAICIGLILGPKVGLGAPLLEAWISDHPSRYQRLRSILVACIIWGIVVGVVILCVDLVLADVLVPKWPESTRRAEEIVKEMPLWKPALASFSAGVNEELWCRFCAMTLFAWLGCRLTRRSDPGTYIMCGANLLAALLFGVLHLPNALDLKIPMTVGVVCYVLLANGLAGVAFGWLYWRRGLAAAMLAHMSADIVLHVVVPPLDAAAG